MCPRVQCVCVCLCARCPTTYAHNIHTTTHTTMCVTKHFGKSLGLPETTGTRTTISQAHTRRTAQDWYAAYTRNVAAKNWPKGICVVWRATRMGIIFRSREHRVKPRAQGRITQCTLSCTYVVRTHDTVKSTNQRERIPANLRGDHSLLPSCCGGACVLLCVY